MAVPTAEFRSAASQQSYLLLAALFFFMMKLTERFTGFE